MGELYRHGRETCRASFTFPRPWPSPLASPGTSKVQISETPLNTRRSGRSLSRRAKQLGRRRYLFARTPICKVQASAPPDLWPPRTSRRLWNNMIPGLQNGAPGAQCGRQRDTLAALGADTHRQKRTVGMSRSANRCRSAFVGGLQIITAHAGRDSPLTDRPSDPSCTATVPKLLWPVAASLASISEPCPKSRAWTRSVEAIDVGVRNVSSIGFSAI